jgi:hypothetical protein
MALAEQRSTGILPVTFENTGRKPVLPRRRGRRIMMLIVGLACGLIAAGCGRDDGWDRYRVTGTVTFDGKPIPSGMIVFTPDVSKQNDGPQGVADIKDGKYDTRQSKDQDMVGGPMNVSVTGLSADGRPLCQYDFAVDLPREDTTKDIEVPKSAASKPQQGEGP